MNELPIPPAAKADRKARELVRVWAAGGAQHVTLDIDLWPDPAMWGLLLVDLARHVAAAFEEVSDSDAQKVLERIHEAWEAEWHHPTDLPFRS